MRGHRHQRAVGEDMLVVAELLDAAENIVPAPAVQPGRVVAQFVQNFVHFERGQDRLDQHRGAHRALRHAKLILRHHKHVVPQPRLKVAFHLRQVEVRPAAVRQQGFGVVKEIHTEVEQAARHGLAIHAHVLLKQVPAARAHQQRRHRAVQAIFAAIGVGELDPAVDRIAQVDVPLDVIVPGGRVGVLEVGHEYFRARVQRVDHHLAVDWPGDLYPSVLQISRDGRGHPVAGANVGGFGKEVGQRAGVDRGLAGFARFEQRFAAGVKRALKRCDKINGLRRQHGCEFIADSAQDLDPGGILVLAHAHELLCYAEDQGLLGQL